MVLVHSEAAPDPAEWDVYAARLHELHGADRVTRVLVFGEGPGPTASQRQKLHYKNGKPVKVAVLTHSLLSRGIVTALSWFFEIKAFAPTEFDTSLDFLGIPRMAWVDVRKCVVGLRIRLCGIPGTTASFNLTDTIGRLDDLVTDRLPKLRERMRRRRDEPHS